MTTTINVPVACVSQPPPAIRTRGGARLARRSPTLSRSELRRLVIDLLG